jgi:hypothetical protein
VLDARAVAAFWLIGIDAAGETEMAHGFGVISVLKPGNELMHPGALDILGLQLFGFGAHHIMSTTGALPEKPSACEHVIEGHGSIPGEAGAECEVDNEGLKVREWSELECDIPEEGTQCAQMVDACFVIALALKSSRLDLHRALNAVAKLHGNQFEAIA